MKDDVAYVTHILEGIKQIEEDIRSGRDAFMTSHTIQNATLRNLQTLTESTQKLSPPLKSENPTIEWAKLSALRNVLVHNYIGIDLNLIWDIVQNDLPTLKQHMERIGKQLGIHIPSKQRDDDEK